MDSGLYAAYAGLLARNDTLDSAASNLSNTSTTGFRAEREYFREVIAGAESLQSQMGKATNSFSVLGGNRVDLSQGQLSATGNPLDLALQGSGFFALQASDGVRYTRDGSFRRGPDGTLEAATGEPVLNPAGRPMVVPTGDVAVAPDGSVTVDGAIAGQLGIFELLSNELKPEGVNQYKLVGSKQPAATTDAIVRQGFLESSNQDVIQGSLQLVLIQRQSEMMQKALNIFNGTLDKTASEDLPKV